MHVNDEETGGFSGTARKAYPPFSGPEPVKHSWACLSSPLRRVLFLMLLVFLQVWTGWAAPVAAKDGGEKPIEETSQGAHTDRVTEIASDALTKATGLVRLSGERFILDLKYASADNFLGQDVYSSFGLEACYVHPDLGAKLAVLHKLLASEGLRLVIYDCFRPIEVQQAMWKILPDSRYVANPASGSLHNRGIAIDCALADEDSRYLEFPTKFDSFEKKAWQAYVCPKSEQKACVNRDRLRKLMQDAGLVPIRTEWWHFQLPNAAKYPLVSIHGPSE